jgi:predicted AlkP superfamily phosphohydrolase/phosphomutase
LNVKGREPEGVIDHADVSAFRDQLAGELTALTDPEGKVIGTRVFKPESVYRETKNIPPDLIVYFGDLTWRSVGSLGYEDYYTFENDTGPDSCNHAVNGLFILYDPRDPAGGIRINGAHVMDIAPTILKRFGMRIPRNMQGRPLTGTR